MPNLYCVIILFSFLLPTTYNHSFPFIAHCAHLWHGTLMDECYCILIVLLPLCPHLLAFVHNGIHRRCFGSTGWSRGPLWALYCMFTCSMFAPLITSSCGLNSKPSMIEPISPMSPCPHHHTHYNNFGLSYASYLFHPMMCCNMAV